jgi:hypothetical protein
MIVFYTVYVLSSPRAAANLSVSSGDDASCVESTWGLMLPAEYKLRRV